METQEIWVIAISVAASVASLIAAIAVAAWYVGGQIKELSGRVDGMEKHFNARLGNVENEVRDIRSDIRSINEHLRHSPA